MNRFRSILGFRPLAGALVLCLSLSGFASGAQEAPQFRSTVELVQLQVGVAGPDGGFVSGLTPADFRLRINGQERPVQVVYEVDLRGATGGEAVVDAEVATARPRPIAARRHFLLLFDFSFTSRRGVLEARRSALEFVDEQVHRDDLVAVATYNRFGFRLLAPFTGDHEQALQAVRTLGLTDAGDQIVGGIDFEESISQALTEVAAGPTGDDGGIGDALAGGEYAQYVAQVANYTEQMRELGRLLQAIEGRKHVVMFSRGFDDRALTGQSLGELAAGTEARASSPAAVAGADPEQMYGSAEIREGLDEMIEAFRAADAVVHAVDPTGLRQTDNDVTRQVSPIAASAFGGGGDLNTGALRNGHQSLVAMAEGTGGTISWGLNDLGEALAKVEESTASYYMIGYRKSADDPATVDLQVEVLAPGAEVTAAPSRLTPPPTYTRMTEAQRQLQLAEFLADDVDRRELSFEAQLVPFPESSEHGKLAVVLEIPGTEIERLAGERGDDRVQLELAALADGDEVGSDGAVRRGITVDVARMRDAGSMADQTVRLSDYLELAPGEYRVRVLVREREIGRLSTRTLHATLPEPPAGRLALARPLLLSSTLATPRQAGESPFDPLTVNGRQVVPEASPRVAPGQPFRALVVVYHLPRNPVSGEVEAGVVLEIEGSDGQAVRVREFEVLGSRHDSTTDVTQLVIQGEIPEEIPTGAGRLWVRMIDGASGEAHEESTELYVGEPLR